MKQYSGQLIAAGMIALALMAWTVFDSTRSDDPASTTSVTQVESAANTGYSSSSGQTTSHKLVSGKKYGDRYADGVLPVGDDRYVSGGAKRGYVYLCNTDMFGRGDHPGAQVRGPWFSGDGATWDIDEKVSVEGKVSWKQRLSIKVSGSRRIISTNDLPSHSTGVFPVSVSDPAYNYDRNPNSISSQSLTYKVSAKPKVARKPYCMGNESGVMTTGVALFNAFDAGGRDAGAWEVQDSCQGHPQRTGEYHYHTLSSCIKDVSVSKVIGYALDGFPITGPKISNGNVLTTRNLDSCHGITSEIKIGGKRVTMYHYVMTQDFPYSVSCFRAKPISAPR